MQGDSVLGFAVRDAHQLTRLLLAHAAAGDGESAARLGQALLDGHGIERDPELALRWFRIAAQAGHLHGINMVGRCLELGWGCPADADAALVQYRIAAERGLDWGQYNYAQLLARRGDKAAALPWYQRAAEQGHAKAMNLVGRFHEEGWGIAQDLDQAWYWFQRSALAGDFRGQCSYAGMLLRQGREVEAERWLGKATATATPAFLLKMREVVAGLPQALFGDVLARIDARLA